MRSNRCIYLLLPAILCGLLSCYYPRYVYGPPAQNVPVLTHKGDSKLAAYYSTNLSGKTQLENGGSRKSRSGGLDVQAAYAISEHLAVQANFMNRTERNFADFNLNRLDTSTIQYKRHLVEVGVGYYNVSNRDRVIFQLFGGAGIGQSNFEDIYLTGNTAAFNRYLKMDVLKFYFQPAFIIKYERFATSISSRFSLLTFNKIQTNYSTAELKSYGLASLGTQNEVFWEPGLVNSFGFRNLPGLQVELQLGMAFLMSDHPVDYRMFNFSAGLMIDLPKLIKGNN